MTTSAPRRRRSAVRAGAVARGSKNATSLCGIGIVSPKTPTRIPPTSRIRACSTLTPVNRGRPSGQGLGATFEDSHRKPASAPRPPRLDLRRRGARLEIELVIAEDDEHPLVDAAGRGIAVEEVHDVDHLLALVLAAEERWRDHVAAVEQQHASGRSRLELGPQSPQAGEA